MKIISKLGLILLLLGTSHTAKAQLFKKLKDKVVNVVSSSEEETSDSNGIFVVRHSKTYETVTVPELSVVKVEQTNQGYKIFGTWWSHEADIYDGFFVEITTKENLRHDEVTSDDRKRHSFSIPEEASMRLGYDPMLPYYQKPSGNFKAAVTDEYQNYTIDKGEVVLDVLDKGNIQLSFSGDVQLRKVIRHSNQSEDYTESFYNASVTGAVDAQKLAFIDNRTIRKDHKEAETTTNQEYTLEPTNQNESPSGIYQFTFETKVKITASEQDRTYTMSYLFNPNTSYMGIKTDMSEYSDEDMGGESIVVLDNNSSRIFVETGGMKMQMPQSMMGKGQKTPSDQMENYDYNRLSKTGNTKKILGALCYEYTMSDADTSMSLWVAPSVKLPNWFMQNNNMLEGHIMEYTVVSKEGTMKSEVVEIHDHINKTIDPTDYRKMF